MWGHFGDRDRNPAGTYYHDSGQHVNYYWNMFDQVLIRPSLLNMFPQDGVEIVTHAGRISTVNLQRRAQSGDRLRPYPVTFQIRILRYASNQ